ncbi:MAG: NUDIX hydrolase [Alphaproteobacteria bacterium]
MVSDTDRQTLKRSIVHILTRLNEGFVVVALALLLANNFANLVFHVNFVPTNDALINLAPLLILAIVALFARLQQETRDRIERLERLSHLRTEVLEEDVVYPIRDMVLNCKQIDILTLSGTITFPLSDEEVVRVMTASRRRSEINILIADPFSENIQTRYRVDEPDTHRSNVNKIEQAIVWLNKLTQQLPASNRRHVNVYIYTNYPTICVFRGDNKIYFSYYGYKLRGNDTPTILTAADERLGRAVIKHFDEVKKESVPISEWISKNFDRISDKASIRFTRAYVGVFLRDSNGAFILQRRDNRRGIENPGKLSVFGGTLERNETPVQAAVRELREETGLELDPDALKAIRTLVSAPNSHDCVLEHYFLVENVDPTKIKVNEGQQFETWPRDIALKRSDITEIPAKVLAENF